MHVNTILHWKSDNPETKRKRPEPGQWLFADGFQSGLSLLLFVLDAKRLGIFFFCLPSTISWKMAAPEKYTWNINVRWENKLYFMTDWK